MCLRLQAELLEVETALVFPSQPGAWKPTPVPEAQRDDVKMVGLWIQGSTGLAHGLDGSGDFSTRLRLRIEILGLRENRLAFRGVHDSPITPSGLLLVQEGLDVVDASAVAAQTKFEDDRFGRRSEKEGVVEIPNPRDGDVTLNRRGRSFSDKSGGKMDLAHAGGRRAWRRPSPAPSRTRLGAHPGVLPGVRAVANAFRLRGVAKTTVGWAQAHERSLGPPLAQVVAEK